LERGSHSLVFGGRAQGGGFETSNRHIPVDERASSFWRSLAYETNIVQEFNTSFLRLTAYAYESWQVLSQLQLVAGVAYDRVESPRNHRFAPIEDQTETRDGFLPKAGVIWNITDHSTARFGYTRSLSGASFDQSFRLEPTQVAGFNQAFRSVIPETLVGAHAGAEFDTFDLAWEHRFPTRTYASLTLELLRSSVDRWRGSYSQTNSNLPVPDHLSERLDYEEKSLLAGLDQLIGERWAAGAGYQWSHADLRSTWLTGYPQVVGGFDPDSGVRVFSPNFTKRSGDLHQLQLRLRYHHPNGFFAGTDGHWWGQEADENDNALPSSWFWQWNLNAGWRSPQRRIECGVGLLNVLGGWSGLHPINLHTDPLRQRTLATHLRLSF
jgi:opacity protein-like surface antigen